MGVEAEISGLYDKPTWIQKNVSHHQAIRYRSLIIHQVSPIQKELSVSLKTLESATGNAIDYVPLGKLGVTLCRLDPGAKRVLGADKKGNISEAGRRDFEAELNEELPHCSNKSVALSNPTQPLRIYGPNADSLAIELDSLDPLLYGERSVVRRYLMQQHPELRNRTPDEDWQEWEPHITIGHINYERLDKADADLLRDDPNEYLLASVQQHAIMESNYHGIESAHSEVVFPDYLSLGGLKVVCDRQEDRIF